MAKSAETIKILEAVEAIDKSIKEDEKELQAVEKSSLSQQLDNLTAMLEKTVSTTTSTTFAQREHLDKQMADVTKRKTPILDLLPKIPANGLTHSWDMVTAIGSTDTAVAECGTPPVNEATITRYSAQVKTFATRVEVCDMAQWAASDYFNLQQMHIEKGLRKIMHDVEKKIYYGDATETPAEFDGIFRLITENAPAGNTIDGAGAAITLAKVDAAILAVTEQGGQPTHLVMGASTLSTFADLWASKVLYNDPNGNQRFGYNVASYMSPYGEVKIVYDPWITAANSPSTNLDAFVLTLDELALAQTEAPYKLPTYRALTLASTETIVWNVVLEMKIPHFQAMISNCL